MCLEEIFTQIWMAAMTICCCSDSSNDDPPLDDGAAVGIGPQLAHWNIEEAEEEDAEEEEVIEVGVDALFWEDQNNNGPDGAWIESPADSGNESSFESGDEAADEQQDESELQLSYCSNHQQPIRRVSRYYSDPRPHDEWSNFSDWSSITRQETPPIFYVESDSEEEDDRYDPAADPDRYNPYLSDEEDMSDYIPIINDQPGRIVYYYCFYLGELTFRQVYD